MCTASTCNPVFAIRKRAGITQAQLAERLEVAPFTVFRWEHATYPGAVAIHAVRSACGIGLELTIVTATC
jgi:DNA-binding XRE family transcriptional regulator